MEEDKRTNVPTFIASVRLDLRDIATIAKFLADRGIFIGTRSKIASEAIRILARGISNDMYVGSYREAIDVLQKLGYDGSLKKGTRYYTSLTKAINFEDNTTTMEDIVKGHMKTINERTVKRLDEKEISEAADILKPVEDLEVKEKSAITRIKQTFGSTNGAPVSKE